MADFHGKTVLITGGASGIGRRMARLALDKGAQVILWDINRESLDGTIAEFSPLGTVRGYQVDVTDLKQIRAAAEQVRSEQGDVDILINNAGIVVGKYFHDHSAEEIGRTMAVNAEAPMHIAQAFLEGMIRRNSGHICNIASSAGLISNPKMAVYAASKWAVIGWSDSLRLEMAQLKKKIGVTTVTPYYINTGMFDGVKTLVPILKPDRVAPRIIRAIEKGKPFLSMPWSVRFVRFFQGLLPLWLFDWFVGRVLGIYRTMEDFRGRDSEREAS